MMKGYSQILKKNIPEDFVDSADELEASIDESDLPSKKLPHSNIKLDPSRFSSKGLEAGHRAMKEKRNSPLREKSSNSQNQAKFDDEESAKLKKMIYNKAPKEAANEYLAMSKQQANQPKAHKKGPKLGGDSSPREKNYPYSFNSGSAYNKENMAREEDYSMDQKVSAHTELAADIYNKKFHSNSQTRQTNLGKTNNDHLLLSQNELQKIEERRYFASGEAQEDVVERLIRQGEIMNENTKALTNAYLTKEFEECTFNPQIKTNKPRRNFDQFLEDQKQFQEQVEMKKKRAQEKALIEKTKEEPSYKPVINQNSAKLVGKRDKEQGPIYQRLYSMGKNAQMKHMRVIAEKEDMYNNRDSVASSQFIGVINTKGDSYYSHGNSSMDRGNTPKFVPNIQKKSKNLRRGERIDNLLYNDALRRQHKTLEASKTQSKTSTAGMSSASKRALAIRFIKEFDIAILEFLEMGKEPKLNYLKLNEFLKKLCFLKESEQVENPHFTPERLLLFDAWYTLQADKLSGVHRRNLLVFLLGILNLHFPITKIQKNNEEEQEEKEEEEDEEKEEDQEEEEGAYPMFDQFKNPILPEEEGQAPRERRIVGSFDDEGNYELSESEVRRLHKIYELWYLNRLCSADNLGQLISMRSQQEYTHHPEINETSRNLAQNYREKMLEGTAELIQQNKIPVPKDGKITHVDLLIVSKKVMEEKVNRYGEMIREEEARDCTFKPAITQYDQGLNTSTLRTGDRQQTGQSRRQKTMPADSLGRDRVYELYSLAKPQILKKDRDALEVDFEKNAEECTFQPNINRENRSFMDEPTEFYAKGIEKTIERMRGARAEKERQLLQKERGFSTGSERNFVFSIDKRKFGKDKTFAEQDNSLQRDVYRGNFAYNYNGAPQYMSNQQAMEHQAHMMQGDTYEGEEEYQNYQYQRHENRGAMYDQQEELNEVQEDENEGENVDSNYNTNRYMQGHGGNEEHPQFQRDQGEERDGDERVPLLFVDVNLGQGRSERIVVYEGDKSEDLAREFAEEHGLDPSMKVKLKELLDSQIASLLSQIDEELNSETERNHQSDNYMHDQIQEEDYVEEESTGGR